MILYSTSVTVLYSVTEIAHLARNVEMAKETTMGQREQDDFAFLLEREASKQARAKDAATEMAKMKADDEELFDNFADRYESILKGHESQIMGSSLTFDDERDGEDDVSSDIYEQECGSSGYSKARRMYDADATIQGNERLNSRLSRIYSRAAREVHHGREPETNDFGEWNVTKKKEGRKDNRGNDFLRASSKVPPARTAWSETPRREVKLMVPEEKVTELEKVKRRKTKSKKLQKKKKKEKKPWKRLTKHKPTLISETFGKSHEKSTLQGMVTAKEVGTLPCCDLTSTSLRFL